MFKTIEEIQDFFRDKRVLIVGNSVELMTQENAELIDSFDIVVRLGRGIKTTPNEELAVGSKVDVWISGLFRIPLLQEEEIQQKLKGKLILLNGSRIDVTDGWLKKTIEEYPYTPLFSDEEILGFYEKYGIINNSKKSFRFSAGMWTIFFMLKKVKTYKSLDIIGFDFFKSIADVHVNDGAILPTSWHAPSVGGDSPVHNGAFEEKIIRKYIDEGKINWIRLNDSDNPRTYTMVKYGTLSQRMIKKRKKDLEILQDIRTVNVDITHICNLTCSFCPQSLDSYINPNETMDLETADKVVERIEEFVKVTGKSLVISFSGTGESTTHPKFREILEKFFPLQDKGLVKVQVVCNGARLFKYRDMIPKFARVRYNDYKDDSNPAKERLIQELKKHKNVEIVKIDNTKEWHEIPGFSDRVGFLSSKDKPRITEPNKCHKLFNKVIIGPTGNYVVCCDDWNHTAFTNIFDTSIKNYLLTETLNKYRSQLLKGVREMEPCKSCTYVSNVGKLK